MAWETRKRGGLYYTRSYREKGRVRRQYIGRGEHAELLAACDAGRQQERAAERARRAELSALDQALGEFSRGVDALMTEQLRAAGYYEHHGEWRRARG